MSLEMSPAMVGVERVVGGWIACSQSLAVAGFDDGHVAGRPAAHGHYLALRRRCQRRLSGLLLLPHSRGTQERIDYHAGHLLNEPIAPETFTIEQFQLQSGERMADKIRNRMFVYNNGELEPDMMYSSRINGIGTLTWINLIGIGCLVFFLFVRLRRKSGPLHT